MLDRRVHVTRMGLPRIARDARHSFEVLISPQHVFVTLDFVPSIAAPILVGRTAAGKVTSADRGYTVGKALASSDVASTHAKKGQEVLVAGLEGTRAGTIHLRAGYDPDGLRVRT